VRDKKGRPVSADNLRTALAADSELGAGNVLLVRERLLASVGAPAAEGSG